ncbi:MAG: hypothetical protein EOP13_18465 [Pseudomonas sp.]|uniref:hypothetical protein n=1 Tax=Pseudomonas sp. TaxID=306 RepID=UPI001215F502|nr:hypothetical protein [Pseudomonas sp.]RZI71331.1 MAG: hypothetical protein EOP13_18465 [Pseudomonas sp.]
MSDQSLFLLTEAAERTGLTVEAIRQRIKRGSLQAVKGNDRVLRVRLTTADLESISNRPATGHNHPMTTGQSPTSTSHRPVDDQLFKALEAAAEARGEVNALRERLELADALADRLRADTDRSRAEREQARIAAATAEGEARALRDALAREARQLERSEGNFKVAETQRDAAQAAREAARAELAAWTSGGPIARAWRAFVNR